MKEKNYMKDVSLRRIDRNGLGHTSRLVRRAVVSVTTAEIEIVLFSLSVGSNIKSEVSPLRRIGENDRGLRVVIDFQSCRTSDRSVISVKGGKTEAERGGREFSLRVLR